MDLSKFLSLLQSKSLFFSRADQLGDPFEGSAPTPEVETPRKRIAAYEGEDLPVEVFGHKSKQKALEFLDQLTRLRKQLIKTMYVSCWHASDHESAAMWRLYGQSQDAVAIRTSYDLLANELPAELHMGRVRYLDYDHDRFPELNGFTPFMSKRRSFEHEREVRAIIWSWSGTLKNRRTTDKRVRVKKAGATVAIDLSEIIQEVFVSPAAPDWFADVVLDVTRAYGLEVPVRHSDLRRTPVY